MDRRPGKKGQSRLIVGQQISKKNEGSLSDYTLEVSKWVDDLLFEKSQTLLWKAAERAVDETEK